MKFIIWGAGSLGRRLRKFLGDRVLAYIDQSPLIQRERRDGLEVLSFSDYLQRRTQNDSDVWMIVAVRDFSLEIETLLHQNGIFKYFVMVDAIRNFADYSLKQMVQQIVSKFKAENEIGFDGLDCLHVVLYEELKKIGYHPVLLISNEKWEEETKRRAALLSWDIRCNQTQDIAVVDDRSILDQLTNVGMNLELEKFHNMCQGRRCFIVATGPSLRMEDLNTLQKHGELCISMNGIYHAFDEVTWRPDFFVIAAATNAKIDAIIDEMDVRYKMVADSNLGFWQKKHPENVYRYHHFVADLEHPETSFSDDLVQGLYGNSTVTNMCIQVAIYLGCNEIYLLGTDFSKVVNVKGRVTHFSSAYDANYTKEELTTGYTDDYLQHLMLLGYQAARKYADEHPPLKIYNATRGGCLEVFERVDFDSLF